MSTTPSTLDADANAAKHGPFEVEITGGGIPATDDPHADAFPRWAVGGDSSRIVKIVSRFTLTVGGEEIAARVPFFHGSADAPREASARWALSSVLDDLASVAPYIPDGGFETADADTVAMIEWADDLGTFATCDSYGRQTIDTRRLILDTLRAWRTIRAWWDLAAERIGEEELRAVVATRDWED